MNYQWKGMLAVSLAAALMVFSSNMAQANLAPATGVVQIESVRVQDIQKIQNFLEHKEVGSKLMEMGLTQAEAQQRLQNLSDREVHEVATRIDQLNPGADGSGVVVTLLVIGILALLFVYLLKRV